MTDKKLHLDFETRSEVDLKKAGVSVYADHHSTQVLCAAFCFDDEPIELVTNVYDIPDSVLEYIKNGGIVCAHNAQFEWTIWNRVFCPSVPLKAQQLDCTMARALAMSLPASLEQAAPALGLTIQKDMDGRRVMLQLCKPKSKKGGKVVYYDEINHPDKYQRLYSYCIDDVEVERQIDKRLMPLSKQEKELWVKDMEINRRGVAIDIKSCEKALEIVELEKKRLDEEMFKHTKGRVHSCGQVKELIAYTSEKLPDLNIESLAKDKILDILSLSKIPSEVRAALSCRLEAAKTSTAKIKAMLLSSDFDDRNRFILQYHAASTGRWGGRKVQFHNVPRPKISQDEIEDIFTEIESSSPEEVLDYINLFYEKPLDILSDCLRGFVTAKHKHDLICADWSAIEARMLAWLAGEDKVLNVFREGKDVYKFQASDIYKVSLSQIDSDKRQIGKVAILSLGYQGGKVAFQSMAVNYGVNVGDERAEEIKNAYRAANKNIVRFWYKLEEACMRAVLHPGTIYHANDIKYLVKGSFLWCQLPSGRALCYPYPRIDEVETPWGDKKKAVTYKTRDSQTRKWIRVTAYGGLLAENVTQAAARDILAEAIMRAEARGYPVVMHVHDEIVCEVKESEGSVEELENIMCELPSWATGLPLKAEGWRGKRYRK